MTIKRRGATAGRISKTKINVLTVTVTAGPYPNISTARAAKHNANQIQNTVTGTIKKTTKGFTFPIIQKFGAKNQTEENKLIKMIHSHRVKKGVPDSHVKIRSKMIRV